MGYNFYVNSKLLTTSLILIFSLYNIKYGIFTNNQPLFLLPPVIKKHHSKVLGSITLFTVSVFTGAGNLYFKLPCQLFPSQLILIFSINECNNSFFLPADASLSILLQCMINLRMSAMLMLMTCGFLILFCN